MTLLRPKTSFPPSSSPPSSSTPGSDTPKAHDKANPFESTSDSAESMGYKDHNPRQEASERTPLLLSVPSFGTHSQIGHAPAQPRYMPSDNFTSAHRGETTRVFDFGSDVAEWRKVLRKKVFELPICSKMALAAVPAVLLGCLLNILDGVSCERFIHFPTLEAF